MAKKGERIKGKVEYILENGTGVLVFKDEKFLLRNVMKDEVVEIEVEKKIKEGYASKVIKIVEPSKDRIKPQCPYYEKCGGCQMMGISYLKQLEYKKDKVKNILKKYADIDYDVDIIQCDDIYG